MRLPADCVCRACSYGFTAGAVAICPSCSSPRIVRVLVRGAKGEPIDPRALPGILRVLVSAHKGRRAAPVKPLAPSARERWAEAARRRVSSPAPPPASP